MNFQEFKTKQLHIRVTLDEEQRMRCRARAAGYKLSVFIRTCALEGKVSPVPSINIEQWVKLAATTSNLNQLTRLANSGQLPSELIGCLATNAELLRQIRASLIGES